MAITAPPNGGKAPITKSFNAQAAKDKSSGEGRPGFDLGGSTDPDAVKAPGASPPGSNITPGGPVGDAPAGSTQGSTGAAATGMSQGAGQAVGGPAGGSRPGEATQATAGAVRPPQSAGTDQIGGQGNPGDAA